MQENVNIPDSTITSALTFRNLVLMNMQQLTNFPYIENDFDALTDYELLCLVVKYLNDVIDNQNEQNDSITNMYNAFLALQTYVNNTKDTLEDAFNTLDNYVRTFFDNLDVQEEVDNKLDEMLENGVLEQIIEQFLQSTAVWCFDTVADMKVTTNLVNGSYVRTLGFHSINDGGASIYKIRTKLENEVPNEMDVIAIGTTLVAELKNDKSYVLPEQFGAYGDYVSDETYHDDKNAIQRCIDYATLYKFEIQFLYKIYYVSDTIYLKDNNPNINGNNGRILSDTDNAIISMNSGDVIRYACIENLNIQGTDSEQETSYGMVVRAGYTTFRHINISHVGTGFYMNHSEVPGNLVGNRYEDMGIRYCTLRGMILGDSDNNKITDGWIQNCTFGSCGDTDYLYIGSCAGYKINNIHTWGTTGVPLRLRNVGRTNIDGIYIEAFTENALSIHLARDCNVSNVTVKATHNDTSLIYCGQSSQVRPRNINISNVFIDTNDADSEPTGFYLVNGEGNRTVTLNFINLKNTYSSYTIKPSNRTNLKVSIIEDELPKKIQLLEIDYTTYTSLKAYVNSLPSGMYYLSGATSYLAGFSDMPTGYLTTGYSNITINKISTLRNTIIEMTQHVSGSNPKKYTGFYNSDSQAATGWWEISLTSPSA